MPQLSLSRPFQIVIVVFILFAGVWLFVLQGHSTSNNGSVTAASTATSASTPTTAAKTPTSDSSARATSTSGSGSSLGALGHAIAKAHHAAAVSQQNANELERKSAQQSGEAAPTQTSATATHTPASTPTQKASATHAAAKPDTKTSSSATASPAHKSAGSTTNASSKLIPSGQRSVETDLAKGNVVVLLFWNPAGTDDVVTSRAVQQLRNAPKVSVQEALAGQVANYGSVTRGVQLYATPTVLVINKHGQAIVLTGVQDAYSIEQAIAEARSS
jgi:hypothetical protein